MVQQKGSVVTEGVVFAGFEVVVVTLQEAVIPMKMVYLVINLF